jgi:hypothetical protein
LNYTNNEIEFFTLTDTLTFTMVDLSKLDWKETQDIAISENYMTEFHFEIADSLKKDETPMTSKF